MPHHLALPPPLAQGGHNQLSAQETDELVNGLVRYAGRRWCNILRGSVILQAGGKTQKAMKDKWRNLQNAAMRLFLNMTVDLSEHTKAMIYALMGMDPMPQP